MSHIILSKIYMLRHPSISITKTMGSMKGSGTGLRLTNSVPKKGSILSFPPVGYTGQSDNRVFICSPRFEHMTSL